MSFIDDHPDYETYESTEFFVCRVPENIASALEGFIHRRCNSCADLKSAINHMAGIIPTHLTQNWGADFLRQDLSVYVNDLCSQPLPKLMDYLREMCESSAFDLNEVNNFLIDYDLGYELSSSFMGYEWLLREGIESRIAKVAETIEEARDICSQTTERLEQCREQLRIAETQRQFKDAVAHCAHALETLMKSVTGKKNIADADKKLRKTKQYMPESIAMDGMKIWGKLHELYPDLRHGSHETSQMSRVEAQYWIDRMCAYIRFIIVRSK